MTRVNKGVPVVEVDGVAEKPVGECRHGCRRFLVCSPNCGFVAMAEPFAVVKSNSSSVGCHPNKCDAEGVEDMHFGVDENFSGMVEKSVSATKRANVSVTGGGLVIGSSLRFEDLLTPLSELGVPVHV